MNIESLAIPDVLLIKPSLHEDDRGFFYELFNQKEFNFETGLNINFVQDNISFSKKNVLRGLHYQENPFEQGKLVSVTSGEVIDVVLDIRKESKTYGQHIVEKLSYENKKQLWIPPGFAHGYYTCSASAQFFYKTTNYYSKEHEKIILWNDNKLNIDWKLEGIPIVSKKDANGDYFEGL